MVTLTRTPRQVWRGNPVSALHRPDPSQIETLHAEIIAGVDAAASTATNAATLAAGKANQADVTALAAAVTTNNIVAETRTQLLTVAGTVNGQGAEVMDSDTGSSPLATGTGYDGASTANAGRYRWVSAWSRWLWIGATGLSGKLSIADIPDHAEEIANAQVDIGRGIAADDIEGVAFAVIDPDTGGATFIAARSTDGAPTTDAARLIARSMEDAGLIGGLSIRPDGTWQHSSGETVAAEANMLQWAGWGSSTMAGLASLLTTAAGDLGAAYFDGGRGGEYNEQILARMGAVPLTLSAFTLPASGAVNVVANIGGGASTPATYAGYLDLDEPVPGTLDYDAGGDTRTFTRATAGSSVDVPDGVRFIPAAAALYRDAVLFLGLGRNDLIGERPLDEITRGNRLAQEWAAPIFKRVLVIGAFPKRDDTSGSAPMLLFEAVRAYEAARYGRFHIDVAGYLFSDAIWTDNGWTKSPTDISELAAGKLPASFFTDWIHLTSQVRAAIVTHLIRPRLISLGWYKEPTP